MPTLRRYRLLVLLAAFASLFAAPMPFASASVAPVSPHVAPADVGVAPQFLRDLGDLNSLIDGADNFVVGGGYLYWSRCRVVDSGGDYYLRRWPVGGGRAITLQSSSFCSLGSAVADDTGLYYAEGGNIVRRSTGDPTTPVVVANSGPIAGRLAVAGANVFYIAADSIFATPKDQVYDPDPRFPDQTYFVVDAGASATNLIVNGSQLAWTGAGRVRQAPVSCVNNCTPQELATEGAATLSSATASFSLGNRVTNPLWVSAGNGGGNGDTLRGYSCSFTLGGRTCSAGNEYTASARTGSRGAIGPLATDGTYLFWVENSVSCGGPFGCSINGNDGQLMKWNLRFSPFQSNPFDTPQPIATQNSGGASFTVGAQSPVFTAGGWVFFFTSNGIARIRADAPPISWNFAADSYEVTQGVQNLSNDVPLVADKPTFVRFYGRKLAGPDAFGVEAILYGTRADGSALPGSPLHPINGSQDFTANNADPNRADIRNGWLFQLPPEWFAAGGIKLRPLIDPRQVWNEPDRSRNALAYAAFSFTHKAPICIVTIPVRTHAPAADNNDPSLFRMADVTRQLLPTNDVWLYHQDDDVAQIEARFGIPPWKYEPYALPDKGGNVLKSLWLRDALSDDPDRCDDAGAVTHYVGIVHAATPMGNELGRGYNPGAQLYTKLIDGGTLATTPQFWQNQVFETLAHELGHNYGRSHVNCGGPANTDGNFPYFGPSSRGISGPQCVLDDGKRGGNAIANYQRYYGFDTGSLTPIDPATVADLMSYNASFWMSDYTWRGLFGAINSTAAADAAQQLRTKAQAQVAAAANVVYLSGSIDTAANTGSLDYAWVYPIASMSTGLRAKLQRTAAPQLSGPTPQAAGSYTLRLRDAAGTLLDERAVTPQASADGNTTLQDFVLTFPAPSAQVARLELTSGGAVIATLQPGGGAPTVSVLSPAGGETVDNQLTVSWRVSDPDASDKLLFTVQYSPDNGAHWRTLLSAFPNRSGGDTTTLNLSQLSGLPGSTSGLIRVAASDGYNTAIATSKPFTVTPRAPVPHIDAPGDAPIPAGQLVIVRGGATDVVDGGLSGAALSWTLNGQSIGSGAQQALSGLAPGSYTLALSATNAAGKTATATSTFTVAPLVVPLTAAPAFDGVCADPVFASAARVSLAPYGNGGQVSVRLVRSSDALWACFVGMQRTGGSSPGTLAGIRIDADNSRDAQPQPGDYLFTLGEDGTVKSYVGNGSGYTTPGPGGASGQVSANGGIWTAELRIDAATLGGWGRVVGLDVEQAWVNAAGDDYFWPYAAKWNVPSTWAATALGDVPQATSLAPASAPAGSGDTTVTINGSGFGSGATVLWNNAARATTVVSSTQVQVVVPAADLATATVAQIAVASSGMQAAPSNALPFTVVNPAPQISQLGLNGKTLTVSGANFVSGATVIWNGEERQATRANSGQLQITLSDADLLSAAAADVTVFNPGPGGGVSNIVSASAATTGGPTKIYLPIVRR